MNAGDIPDWLTGPADFSTPDPFTPLFDSLWSVMCMSGKHSDKDHNHLADAAEEELEQPDRFAGGDGSVYRRASPDEFDAKEPSL